MTHGRRRSTYSVLGWPESIGALLVTLALIVTLAPYFGAADFGVFKVPALPAHALRILRLIGPIVLILALSLFAPIWPEKRSVKSYNQEQRRCYAAVWAELLKIVDVAGRNLAQVTFEDRSRGAAHHYELAEPGYELIRTVDQLAPMLESEHYERVREYATSYCHYHENRRMEYRDKGCNDPGVWTPERGAEWKKLFFDDKIELEKIFREVLTSGRD